MIVHIEAVAGKKPIIRIILDHDEPEPEDTEAVRSLLLQGIRTMPTKVDRMTIIKLPKKGD